MKIDNSIILNKLYMGVDNELFKEGDVLEGKIINIADNIVTIEIEGLGILKASIKNNSDYYDGKISKFLVKSSLPDRVELKVLLDNLEVKENTNIINEEKDYLSNILKGFNIKDDHISREVLETLIKYNVNINEDNLVKSIRIYDKLDHVLNMDTDDVVTAINQEDSYDVRKANIANILIENKDNKDFPQFESIAIDKEDLTAIVKESLEKGHLNYKTKSDLIKTIGFFVKFNIKPTLNNFRYILELKENSFLFSEDFKTLKTIIDKKFTNLGKRVNIDRVSHNMFIGKDNSDLKQTLNIIGKFFEDQNLPRDKKIKQTIKELNNKIEFIDEMNKELSFVYFPLNAYEKDYEGLITLLKKRKLKDGFQGKLNIFIDLKTKTLGEIKISCQVTDYLMAIKFIDIDSNDLELFESKEEDLRNLVKPTGYKIGDVEYLFTDNYSILDSMAINKNSTYLLDVQV